MPELVVESVLRDSLAAVRNDLTILDDIFGNLTRPYANDKYGLREIETLKTLFQQERIEIAHSFPVKNSRLPTISIQLASEREDLGKRKLGDRAGRQTKLINPALLVRVPQFTPDSYDPKTGKVLVPDSVDISGVYANLLFVDQDSNEFVIIAGGSNEIGNKHFYLEKNLSLVLGPRTFIKTSINCEIYTIKSNSEMVDILLGVHTENSLTTRFLYGFVKYTMLSRKSDLQKRDFQISTYSGSDFNRDSGYPGDVVFTRFLTLSGLICNDWRGDKVQLIDSVGIDLRVPADEFGNKALNIEDQTVKTDKP